MLFGPRLKALGFLLFSSLLAYANPCHAWSVDLDSPKSKALAHYIMAVCHDINGESSQAIAEYRQSIKFQPSATAPRLKLGAYYLRLDKTGEAVQELKAAARISPKSSQAHYLLALIYSSEHQYDEAAAEYEMMLRNAAEDDPSNKDVYMYLGQLYYSEGKFTQAAGEFQKVLSADPKNTSALFLLGSVYADTMDHAKAVGFFRRVLQIDPGYSEALNSLGYVYAEDNAHLDEALHMVQKAIEIDPANGAYYDSLGWVLYKKGLYAQSLMALQKAQTFIEDAILYDHLGDVFKALKQYTLARRYWRKALDLDPHQILVQQKIRALEKWTASPSAHRLN